MTSDIGQAGQNWTQDEIDLVVADYFDMRAKFLHGENFIKARHYERIIEITGRTKPSVERKYMNISATLERLCLPWLKGYAPLRNFQNALLQSVEQFVASEWNDEIIPVGKGNEFHDEMELFVESAPERNEPVVSDNPELERIARKFDPALRDERNRRIGYAGEKKVMTAEISRLKQVGRPDLAKKVQWVSQELGDGAGYDIKSYTADGDERFLEVKTTVGHKRTPFFLSRNEKEFSDEASDRFRIYRLYNWGQQPRAFLIEPPLESRLIVEPSAYRASFG